MEYSQQPPTPPPPPTPAAPPAGPPPDSGDSGDNKFKILSVILLAVAIGLGVWLVIALGQKSDAEDEAAQLQAAKTASQTVSAIAIEEARRASKRLAAERKATVRQVRQAEQFAKDYEKAQQEQDEAARQKAIADLQKIGYSLVQYNYETGEAVGIYNERLAQLKEAADANDTEKIVELLAEFDLAELEVVLNAIQNSGAAQPTGNATPSGGAQSGGDAGATGAASGPTQ